MRGISEETLREILADKAEYKMSKPYINAQEKLLKALIDHCCKELNTRLPINNAPKDRPLILLWPELGWMQGEWNIDHWYCDMWELTGSCMSRQPTHYQELPIA